MQPTLFETGETITELDLIVNAYRLRNKEIGYYLNRRENVAYWIFILLGFTKKSAKVFFFSIKRKQNQITVIDIRLNNKSQLAGFTKEEDLRYFLNEICSIEYKHDPDLAPSKEDTKQLQR